MPNVPRKVVQCDRSGNDLREFRSAKEAALFSFIGRNEKARSRGEEKKGLFTLFWSDLGRKARNEFFALNGKKVSFSA